MSTNPRRTRGVAVAALAVLLSTTACSAGSSSKTNPSRHALSTRSVATRVASAVPSTDTSTNSAQTGTGKHDPDVDRLVDAYWRAVSDRDTSSANDLMCQPLPQASISEADPNAPSGVSVGKYRVTSEEAVHGKTDVSGTVEITTSTSGTLPVPFTMEVARANTLCIVAVSTQ